MISALAAISWSLHYRKIVSIHSACAVTRLAWDKQRGWRLHRNADGWLAAKLVTPVYVTRHLTVVHFKVLHSKTCRVIVVADRLFADDFRRLRVRLIQSAHGH